MLSPAGLKNKKIIIVLYTFALGGAEQQAFQLARYLQKKEQACVEMWAFSQPGPVSQLCSEHGLAWKSIRTPRVMDWKRAIPHSILFAWQLRQAKPDIMLAYTHSPNLACGLSWRFSGAQTCIWNQRDEGKGLIGRKVESIAIHWTPCFIANSAAGATLLIQKGAPPDRVHIIYNSVDLRKAETSPESWRRRLGVDQRTFLACMVANLSVYKDHKTILRAWSQVCDSLSEKGVPALLLLAGRLDPAYPDLQALTKELHLENHVRFLGEVNDIAGLLNTVQLGVYSSYSEGFPNAILEYMIAGLPVVGTNIPGIKEALGQEQFEYLVPPGDVNGFAVKILLLAENRDLRLQLGEINRRRAEAEFNPDQQNQKTVEVILKAIKTRS